MKGKSLRFMLKINILTASECGAIIKTHAAGDVPPHTHSSRTNISTKVHIIIVSFKIHNLNFISIPAQTDPNHVRMYNFYFNISLGVADYHIRQH